MIITYLVPSLCATKPCYDSGGMAGKWRLAVDTQNGTEQRHASVKASGSPVTVLKQTRIKRGKPGRPFLEKKKTPEMKKQENNWGICLWHFPCPACSPPPALKWPSQCAKTSTLTSSLSHHIEIIFTEKLHVCFFCQGHVVEERNSKVARQKGIFRWHVLKMLCDMLGLKNVWPAFLLRSKHAWVALSANFWPRQHEFQLQWSCPWHGWLKNPTKQQSIQRTKQIEEITHNKKQLNAQLPQFIQRLEKPPRNS